MTVSRGTARAVRRIALKTPVLASTAVYDSRQIPGGEASENDAVLWGAPNRVLVVPMRRMVVLDGRRRKPTFQCLFRRDGGVLIPADRHSRRSDRVCSSSSTYRSRDIATLL